MTRSEKITLCERLIASCPEAKLKGATMPYTSLNGHMYSYFTKDDYLALRLPEGERQAFLKKYRSRPVEQYGIVQKEYVEVPETLLNKTDELKSYFQISYSYVSTLKPKPTTKKKK
jgi:hypothetical protein